MTADGRSRERRVRNLSRHGACIEHDNDLTTGRLQRVLPDWSLPATPVYFVTTSRLLPAKARSFIDFAMKRLPAILAAEDAERKASARKPGLIDRGVGLSKSA